MTETNHTTDSRTVTHLDCGEHADPSHGLCLLEAAAYLAGEPHSDHPKCVCPVLAAFGRAINDSLGGIDRQSLLPLVPRLIGTRGDSALELRRAYIFADAAVREFAPAALDAVGLTEHAAALRVLPEIVDTTTAETAAETAEKAAVMAAAARSAAWSAARSASAAAARSAAEAAEEAARAAEAVNVSVAKIISVFERAIEA